MSELRYNIATGDWVIFSKARAKRPHDFVQKKNGEALLPERSAECPFCPGNEKIAGDALFSLGEGKSWKVRSVPNKYPALSRDEDTGRKTDGFYTSIGGFGSHEVVIESPRHNTCMALMTSGEIEDILRVYRERYVSLMAVPGIESVTIFKNHGPMAGCSMAHPHSQIVATPVVPPQLKARIALAVNYFEINGTCVYCRMLSEELKAGTRIIQETDSFISFLPFAGVLPFVTWIVPRRHRSSFADIDGAELKDLARALKHTLDKLYYGLADPDFNLTVRSYPAKSGSCPFFHWHVSVIPRLSEPGGFELGTMMPINTSLPEEGAEYLRQVKLQQS